MDVDGPQNDKGLYALVPVQQNMTIRNEDMISWTSFRGRAGQQAARRLHVAGLAGRQYVVTTISAAETTLRDAVLLRRQLQGLPLPPGLLSHARHPRLVRPRRTGKLAAAARRRRPALRPDRRRVESRRQVPRLRPRRGAETPIRQAARWPTYANDPNEDPDPVRPLPHSLQRRQRRRRRSHRRRLAERHEQQLPQGLAGRPLDRLRQVPQRPADAPRQPALHRSLRRRRGAADALQHAADELLAQLLAQRPLAGVLLQEPLALHADVPHAHRREGNDTPRHPDRELHRRQSRRQHSRVRQHPAGGIEHIDTPAIDFYRQFDRGRRAGEERQYYGRHRGLDPRPSP